MTKEDLWGVFSEIEMAEDIVIKLKKEKLPLILWGAGDVADAVCDFLESQEIAIDCVWVDEVGEKTQYRSMQVECLEQILEKHSEFNVILGHSHYELGEMLKEKYSQIKNVFYIFSPHYGQFNRVPYEKMKAESERFVKLCNGVADEISVQNLIAYLKTKMSGDVKYILDVYKKEMNFFNNDIFVVGSDECYLDIGAYDGDTIKLFLDIVDEKYRKIIALEPDNKSFLRLSEYVARERLKNVILSKMGAWDKRVDLHFSSGKEQLSNVIVEEIKESEDTSTIIYANRIDETFDEDISMVKINYYEGVYEAVRGCEKLIRKCHPKIAVDVGFDIYNVLKLFEYITSLNEGYKLFLRFNRAISSTFTLYAIV